MENKIKLPHEMRSKRGFAAMDEFTVREIASDGGRAVPAGKRAFSQDRALASAAGRKGRASQLRRG